MGIEGWVRVTYSRFVGEKKAKEMGGMAWRKEAKGRNVI